MITIEIRSATTGISQSVQTSSETVTAWMVGLKFYSDAAYQNEVAATTGTVSLQYDNGTGVWRSFEGEGIDLPTSNYDTPRATGDRVLMVRALFDGVDAAYCRITLLCDTDVDASMSKDLLSGNRLKTQTVDPSQQWILDGFAYDWWWRKRALAQNTRTFLRFIVPAGFYMALDNRIFLSNSEQSYYRVYSPASVNLAGSTLGADVPLRSNLRMEAGINHTGFATEITLPTPPTVDDAFIEIPLFGTQGQGNSQSGEFDAENAFRLLSPGATFYLELDNASANASYIKLRLILAFVPIDRVTPLP